MASIRQIAQDVLYEARDGIAWIALYKKGRSWNAECFWGLLNEQEVFTTDYPEDAERLCEIISIDPNAIFVNAYLHNLGPIDEEMTRDTLAKALRWQYDMQYFRLADTSIKPAAEPGFDDPVEVDSSPATVSNAKPDIPQQFGHCFRGFQSRIPFRNHISLSVASPKSVRIPTCDLHQRPPPFYELHQSRKECIILRRGKKPTRKQKEQLQRAGLPPDNWLIIREKPTGEMIILHRNTNKTRYVPAPAGQANTPVKKEYIMNYMYIGNVSGHSTNPSEPDTLTVFLHDPDEKKKAPVMLTAHGTLAQYIHELSCADHEEKYMRKRFHYNGFCVLQKVDVLDYKSSTHAVKTVTEGSDFSEFID